MKYALFVLSTLAFGLIGNAHAATDNPMTFYLATSGGNCSTCTWIVAEGIIENDTDKKFIDFLAKEKLSETRGIDVHLNSPGGNLLGGVLLGLAIRKQEANTIVSASKVESIYESGLRQVTNEVRLDAECSSACVFAFAGGVSRFASKFTPGTNVGFQNIGRLGVHQFYNSDALANPTELKFNAEDKIADQKIISLLLAFLSKMNVSAEVLQLAANTDTEDMHYLSEEELSRTQIDNRMVVDLKLTGYKNGVAIAQISYQRSDADYQLDIYCDSGKIWMLANIKWRNLYDLEAHESWNLFDNISLPGGGKVHLINERFSQSDGRMAGILRFKFEDTAEQITALKQFAFEDWSSRYANDLASSLSFSLPHDFNGLYVLPRTCL